MVSYEDEAPVIRVTQAEVVPPDQPTCCADEVPELRETIERLEAEIQDINRAIRHIMQAMYCGAPN